MTRSDPLQVEVAAVPAKAEYHLFFSFFGYTHPKVYPIPVGTDLTIGGRIIVLETGLGFANANVTIEVIEPDGAKGYPICIADAEGYFKLIYAFTKPGVYTLTAIAFALDTPFAYYHGCEESLGLLA